MHSSILEKLVQYFLTDNATFLPFTGHALPYFPTGNALTLLHYPTVSFTPLQRLHSSSSPPPSAAIHSRIHTKHFLIPNPQDPCTPSPPPHLPPSLYTPGTKGHNLIVPLLFSREEDYSSP